MSRSATLLKIYYLLLKEYDEQGWWPADAPFEVMIGAILTQNTAWTNVETAITGLKNLCNLTPDEILSLPEGQLQKAIRASGYFRQKAERLHTLCRFLLSEYSGDFTLMECIPIRKLRQQFLDLKGIGPETADSILLYALEKPVFVVDTYTKRLFSRLGLCDERSQYGDIQNMFMDNLSPDVEIFNEYHALIVKHSKQKCTKRAPACNSCTLNDMCTFADSRFQISDFR